MPGTNNIKAFAFDAYGTLFDIHSVIWGCEELFPGQGQQLSQLRRAKQLEYSWFLSLMRRYRGFSVVTEQALTFACKSLTLPYESGNLAKLIDSYLHLTPYPDVRPAF